MALTIKTTTTTNITTNYIFKRNGATLESTAEILAKVISGPQVAALRIIAGGNVKYYYSGNARRMTAASGVSPVMLNLLEKHHLLSSTGRGFYTATLTPLAKRVLEIKNA